MGEVALLASWSVLSIVSGAYLAMKRGLCVYEDDLLGLVVSPEYGQLVLTSLRREASVWVKLTSLALWSTLSMVSGNYLTTKRGLGVGEFDLLGLVASPEYGQRCLSHYEEASVTLTSLASWSALSIVSDAYLTTKRGLCKGKFDLLGLVVSPKDGQRCLPHYKKRPPCR